MLIIRLTLANQKQNGNPTKSAYQSSKLTENLNQICTTSGPKTPIKLVLQKFLFLYEHEVFHEGPMEK